MQDNLPTLIKWSRELRYGGRCGALHPATILKYRSAPVPFSSVSSVRCQVTGTEAQVLEGHTARYRLWGSKLPEDGYRGSR